MTPAMRHEGADSVRIVQGMDITGDLRSMCPALTLQQLYRLTEYQHDDWITGGQNTDTLGLLETIKRIVDGFHVPVPPPPHLHPHPPTAFPQDHNLGDRRAGSLPIGDLTLR